MCPVHQWVCFAESDLFCILLEIPYTCLLKQAGQQQLSGHKERSPQAQGASAGDTECSSVASIDSPKAASFIMPLVSQMRIFW